MQPKYLDSSQTNEITKQTAVDQQENFTYGL